MKKAIDWVALAVGLALALFGARWMWTGWDIVQAERGWTAVIAGSAMLSGGLIVAMLAWTIMRLSGAPGVERQAPPAQAEPPSPFRKSSLATPAAIAAGAGAIVATTGAALARKATPDEPAPDEPPKDAAVEPLPPPLPPTAPPTIGELLRMSEERAIRDSHEKHFEEPETAPPPIEEAKAEPPPARPPTDSDEEDKDEDALEEVESREAAEEPATVGKAAPVAPQRAEPSSRDSEPPPAPLRLPEMEPAPSRAPAADDEPVYDDWLERTAREFDRELGRDALPKDEPPPVEEPAAPPKPEPAVVGRYSSGDTNYLMFADGSIEAQTPEGVMRFSSLTELKRFVEKRN